MENKIASVLHRQMGEMAFFHTLLNALVDALPPDVLEVVHAKFEVEAELTRTMHLSSGAPDEMLDAFEHYADAWKAQHRP